MHDMGLDEIPAMVRDCGVNSNKCKKTVVYIHLNGDIQ